MKIKTIVIALAATMLSVSANAQSWKDLLNKVENVVSTVTGANTTTDITGTWNYSQPGVKFKSENLLAQAGGAAAAATVKDKLATYYSKVGIRPGAFTLTFNEDKTFTGTIGKRTISGTYTYEDSVLTLTPGSGSLGLGKGIAISTALTSNSLSLLFNVDKLLAFIQTFSSSSNTTLSTLGTLAKSYDGMSLGFDMTR